MGKTVALALALIGVVLALGCSGVQTTPASPTPTVAVSGGSSAAALPAAAVQKTAIAGTLDYRSEGVPSRTVTTPSDICHMWDDPVYDYFDGDVVGPVTFYEQGHGPCDYSRVSGSGPFEADVVWQGRTGRISGQWTTNCKADPTSPVGIFCDGTMNARGSGGLEGVQFHFKWGPGWYPFPYSGTAFAK